MPYRPTGRAPGRPRGPLTLEGKVRKARTTLPHVRAFPDLRRAVDRAVFDPGSTIVKVQKSSSREITVEHRYTPNEREQVLSFAWWVYSNRNVWPSRKLTSSVTAISPLMMFSSSFFSQMTGLPQSTVSKHMVKSPDISISKVTGTCSIEIIYNLLEKSQEGVDVYREFVAKLAVTRRVPRAMLSRISGVPVSVLTQPEKGVQFFPEEPDYLFKKIISVDVIHRYWERKKIRSFDPRPGDQEEIRSKLQGRDVGFFTWTSVPVTPGILSYLPLIQEGSQTKNTSQNEEQNLFPVS